MYSKNAKFFIGQVVQHKRYGYRGVVIDVDPAYQSVNENMPKLSIKPQSSPWYHLLVHEQENEKYVSERHLQPDMTGDPVDHPFVEMFFSDFKGQRYTPRHLIN